MQPTHDDVVSDVLTPKVQLAREAFLGDDLSACLEILDGAADLSAHEQREAILLRARTLIRTDRFADAVLLLGPVLDRFGTVDEACTARMLHGAAVSRTPGNLERGQSLLEAVSASARTLNAHRAIQAEIAYMLAFVHWMKREHEAVLRYAIEAERAAADVISVRAATLRGYVALAMERYPEALALFRSAHHRYAECAERDANLSERILVQIASLEVTFRSDAVCPSHPASFRSDGAPSALRMQIAGMEAWAHALDGEVPDAYRQARIAEDLAPDRSWRMWALANRALLTAAFGDLYVAAEFAAAALEIVETIDWNETDEQRVGLLFLAEVLTQTDPLAAVRVLDRYDALATEIDRSSLFHDDVRLWIRETFVRALVQRIRGDEAAARESLALVHAAADRIGHLWRAALALIELDATSASDSERGRHHLQAAASLVRRHFPRSFVARRLGRWYALCADPVAASLAPQPREVIRHVLTGKNPKEIATLMGLSEMTVKGYLKTLFRAFDVHSTPELLVACYRRGIGDPAWWNALDEASRFTTTSA